MAQDRGPGSSVIICAMVACVCVCVCVCVRACVCALRSMPWWVCSISPTQISAFDDISLKLVSVVTGAVTGSSVCSGCSPGTYSTATGAPDYVRSKG